MSTTSDPNFSTQSNKSYNRKHQASSAPALATRLRISSRFHSIGSLLEVGMKAIERARNWRTPCGQTVASSRTIAAAGSADIGSRSTLEIELQWSGMAISKKSSRVLKVTYFEIIVCPPTSTLKLKLKIDTNIINMHIEL